MSDERLLPQLPVDSIDLEVQEVKADQPDAAEPSEAAQLLHAEIALTRQRVASEVDAIAERIKPENIKRQVVSSLQRRALSALDLALRNPVPLAMACGAALLLVIWRARARSV